MLAAQGEASKLAQMEIERRAEAAKEAQELVKQGDEAYQRSDFQQAVESYERAVKLLPKGAVAVSEMRVAAIDRLVQASVELSKAHRSMGDLEAAENTLERVEGIAPEHALIAQERRALRDPIQTNPALTKEHAAAVEEVRLLLYKAEGAYALGKFNQAMMVYEDVLRIDSTNVAARRGMEKVAAAQSDYARAAYDHTRAQMLAEVERGWEQVVTPVGRLGISPQAGLMASDQVMFLEKLSTIRIPVIDLNEVTLFEAVDFLRQQSVDLDSTEPDPMKRGINIVIDLGGPDSPLVQRLKSTRFDLALRDVSLGQAIEYVTQATGTEAVKESFAMVIRPIGGKAGQMSMRTYRVPPDFLTSGTNAGSNPEVADPFAPQTDDGGLLAKRLTAKEVLESRGVSFPEGSMAHFSPVNNTLRMRNTDANHSIVEQIVEMISTQEPTAVVVEVKMIETTQSHLEELGFDWLLGDFGFGSPSSGVPGLNSMFLTGGTEGNGGDLSDIALGGPITSFKRNPITAGNRSGNGAISSNSIDGVLGTRVRGDNTTRAPGALWVNGVIEQANLNVLMRALDQNTGVDMLSMPSVTTRSGQSATVRGVREFIYPTEYDPPEIPDQIGAVGGGGAGAAPPPQVPVTPANPTAFEMRETGVILEVLPTASEDKRYVDISLAPQFVEFDGFVNYGTPILAAQDSPVPIIPGFPGLFGSNEDIVVTENRILMPVFSRISTNTSLTIADSTTVVIGGLLEERVERVNDQTPLLGDIPLVGRLFQSKASKSTKKAIVIFVTVKVVDAAGRRFHP